MSVIWGEIVPFRENCFFIGDLKMANEFCDTHSVIVRLSIIFRMNLYELIKKNNFQGFSIALIRRFAYALLQSLRMLHHERIIHCDLKPENILLRQKGQSSIKVIDFGSSCYEHQRGKYFRINFITAAD